MKDFFNKLSKYIFEYLKKNEFNIWLCIGINFILLYVLKYNFTTIKIFFNYTDKIYSILDRELLAGMVIISLAFAFYFQSFKLTRLCLKTQNLCYF